MTENESTIMEEFIRKSILILRINKKMDKLKELLNQVNELHNDIVQEIYYEQWDLVKEEDVFGQREGTEDDE